MKSFKSCLLAGVAGLMVLMSSCLNGNNVQSGAVIGVVGFSTDAGRYVLQTETENFYFQGIEDATTYFEGSCWLMRIIKNYDEQTSNKFSIVTLETPPIRFDVNSYVTSLTNGEIVLESNEQNLELVVPYGIVKDRLFIETGHKNKTNQVNTLRLYFDPAQEPEKIALENNTECNVYTVYLRSICTHEGEDGPTKNEMKQTAFDLGYFGRDIKEKEKAQKKYYVGIKVRYIKSIKEDGTFELASDSESAKVVTFTGYTGESVN